MLLLKLDDLISYWPQSTIEFKTFKFNGGEQHIQLLNLQKYDFTKSEVIIEASITNSDKLMLVFLATDALKRLGCKNISLFAPYLPYARQDRVCNEGEPLSIKVICDLINAQKYKCVYTLDNHSEVANALLNNYIPIKLIKLIKRQLNITNKDCLISPDAGSLKKIYEISKQLGGVEVIECSKKRNVVNGEIEKTIVYYDDLSKFNNCIIIDDICDGGRTFIELAKGLKEKNAKCILLYVSHGIFSKGLYIFNGLIDIVYTTKSFKNNITDILGEGFRYDDK